MGASNSRGRSPAGRIRSAGDGCGGGRQGKRKWLSRPVAAVDEERGVRLQQTRLAASPRGRRLFCIFSFLGCPVPLTAAACVPSTWILYWATSDTWARCYITTHRNVATSYHIIQTRILRSNYPKEKLCLTSTSIMPMKSINSWMPSKHVPIRIKIIIHHWWLCNILDQVAPFRAPYPAHLSSSREKQEFKRV